MNYSDMSDFEINKAVAIVSGKKIWAECYSQWVKLDRDNPLNTFDPCNNPSCAWPIIVDNDIMLNPNCADNLWKAEQGFRVKPNGWYNIATCYNKNPLRAAMIVFLMMNEGSDGL